jgi:hypothetical protein
MGMCVAFAQSALLERLLPFRGCERLRFGANSVNDDQHIVLSFQEAVP